MHEFSLVQELVDMVSQNAAAKGISQVGLIRLLLGTKSGVSPESLELAFQVLSQGTVCAGASLEIATVENSSHLEVEFYEEA